MKLAGRAAIITGASLGLGAEIARQFVAEGAALMLCARNSGDLEAQRARLVKEYPAAHIHSQRADISIKADVDSLFGAAASALGKVDIVVNNAGVHGPLGPVETVDWDAWTAAIAINLLGTIYCCRKAVELFKPNRYGKIINLSGGGATSPQPGISAYAASKAAVVRFTETLAMEVKEFGIDVNAVAPGALATRLMDELVAAGPERIGATVHERTKQVQAGGRASTSRAASLCVYLASPKSDGVTGRLISAQWDPWPFANDIKDKIAASDIYTLRRIVPADRGEPWG